MNKRTLLLWLVIGILILTFLPWLGETLFNTKGEPREAIVALSMMQSGNYVLPLSCGTDIPYKPPFLAWLIVGCSWLTGGEVTEFSSRMPSALATIAMGIGIFCFFRKYESHKSDIFAFAVTIITVTSVEVWRAASACRVDMVLTACTVGALLLLFATRERKGRPSISICAIILMTCAGITKGPVGVLLPCLVMWVYYLVKGDNFWRSTLTLTASAIMACILPGVWYWLAAAQGGDKFISLALEENIGRLTGTMSYESHVNPWWYNFLTLILGMLPYTLLALLALFHIRRPAKSGRTLEQQIRTANPVKLFSLITIIVIIGFYCIPKSKRSVYLLPVYPFLAYLVTLLWFWLIRHHAKAIKIYSTLICSIGIIVALLIPIFAFFDVATWLPELKPTISATITALDSITPGIISISLSLILLITSLVTLKHTFSLEDGSSMIYTLLATVCIYLNLSATILPPILNQKSDYEMASQIQQLAQDRPIYGHISRDPLLRYYTVGFYTSDKVKAWHEPQTLPATGALLLLCEDEATDFINLNKSKYTFEPITTFSSRSCDTRRPTEVYRISPLNP